jgi:hypothetical protein
MPHFSRPTREMGLSHSGYSSEIRYRRAPKEIGWHRRYCVGGASRGVREQPVTGDSFFWIVR